MAPTRPNPLHLIAASVLILLVLTLWAVRVTTAMANAGRMIGVTFADTDTDVRVEYVAPDGAARRAGLRAGDVLLSVDGKQMESYGSYEAAAAHFSPDRAVTVQLVREGQVETTLLQPGRAVRWLPHGVAGFVTFCSICLGLLALYRRGHDLRARLIAAFCFLLATELAMPVVVIGDSRLDLTVTSLFLLVTGAQLAVELHLASVTPDRHRWLRERPWVVPLYYLLGLGFGVVAWATLVGEETRGQSPFPWSYFQLNGLLNTVLLPIWALAVLGILALPTLRHETARGRQQAGLVFLGILPWGLYVASTLVLELLGRTPPRWLDDYFSLVVLAFPVAVAVSIYRYHLFDIDLVVRRSFLYTALTSSLVLVFYVALGALGTLVSKVVDEDEYSLWTLAAAMFVVGLLFGHLRGFLQRTVDGLFFPERQALRRSLVRLASQLPARGTVAAMGEYLVEQLVEIFAVRSAALMLVDPASGLVSPVASSTADDDQGFRSLLISTDDPGLVLLREQARPLPAAQVLDTSPLLAQRFESSGLGGYLMAPLMSNERLVGVLLLGKQAQGRGPSREEVELLSLLTHQIATAFENIRLFESATYESLTGLLRREAILQLLDREIERAQRYGRPLVVGMADLDFFKSVNDRHGHLAGDIVLKRVAEELQSGLRSTDAVGRYGGEEFLLVLPETRLEGGRAVAEKLRGRIESLHLEMDDGSQIDPRISIGLAELPPSPRPKKAETVVDSDSSTLVQRIENRARLLIDSADQALYRAKAEGRNRVESSSPIQLELVPDPSDSFSIDDTEADSDPP